MVEPAPGTPAALVRRLLANLLKAALTADDRHSLAWRQEARRIRSQLMANPSALERLKIDGLWWLAIGDAEAPELRAEEKMIEWGQPKICPITIAEISASDFDVDRAVQHLRETAATG
ncbi:hypothetical protein [Methylobacterium soli]|uniref:DUF29 domain-containing protein n=1 Tax=Methylobacterium soli TaxID=553447 RepID=A0A6L3SQ23_9HYPH|nr:hypothetical protein [Methylobacterium soli]KAB1072556.1 hypothetical protein F6X53_28135 [Methylobacterium soli]GJE43836.1 hypothetical protein AEGHOMDF_3015 [Methylobacterium soli]